MSNQQPGFIRRDPLFKGCTRPAMLWGVPIIPFIGVMGGIVMLAMWISLFMFVLLIPAFITMRLVVKTDDQMFRLLGLKAKCRLVRRNRNGLFWKASAYSPNTFKRRK